MPSKKIKKCKTCNKILVRGANAIYCKSCAKQRELKSRRKCQRNYYRKLREKNE